jgi:SAM-dependent methyltransferase
MTDSTKRFSTRVENYIKYRPGYPSTLIDLLRERCDLTKNSVVADIGSGTGILTELLLKNGNTVFAVEPNDEMRKAAERLLADYSGFKSIGGTAERTTLTDHSVDLITVAQAFHWFDREKTRAEFNRVLKRDGHVVLIWNDRKTDSRPFLAAYESFLLEFGTDYAAINHKQIDRKVIASFFGSNGFSETSFPNEQVFDFEALRGRLLSASYIPDIGHPQHERMLKALRSLFDQYQSGGKVIVDYDAIVYYGRLTS